MQNNEKVDFEMINNQQHVLAAVRDIKAQVVDLLALRDNLSARGLPLSEYEAGRLCAYQSALLWLVGYSNPIRNAA